MHVARLETTICAHRSATATIAAASGRLRGRTCPFASQSASQSGIMKATIYHNPKCGTSRKTLEILRNSGADVLIHEYLKTPPTREQLEQLYRRAGISPRAGLRAKEPLAAELGLTCTGRHRRAGPRRDGTPPDPDRAPDRRNAEGRSPVPPARPRARDSYHAFILSNICWGAGPSAGRWRGPRCNEGPLHRLRRSPPHRKRGEDNLTLLTRLDPRLLLQGYATGIFRWPTAAMLMICSGSSPAIGRSCRSTGLANTIDAPTLLGQGAMARRPGRRQAFRNARLPRRSDRLRRPATSLRRLIRSGRGREAVMTTSKV